MVLPLPHPLQWDPQKPPETSGTLLAAITETAVIIIIILVLVVVIMPNLWVLAQL